MRLPKVPAKLNRKVCAQNFGWVLCKSKQNWNAGIPITQCAAHYLKQGDVTPDKCCFVQPIMLRNDLFSSTKSTDGPGCKEV